MIERKGIIQFKDRDVSIAGVDMTAGMQAPEFKAINQDWQEISVLEATKGKLRIIASLPSLDTSVCDRETRRFNQEASNLGNNVALIAISADLPFAQARWCGAAGVDRITVLSDHKYVDFGEKYACLLVEPRILRRAVFIVDREDKIRYAAYMPELGVEPDYAEVMQAVKSVLNE